VTINLHTEARRNGEDMMKAPVEKLAANLIADEVGEGTGAES
jgi:hypothetical protein